MLLRRPFSFWLKCFVRWRKLKFSAWRVAFLPTDTVSLSLICLACLRQRRWSSAWAMRSVRRDSVASAMVVVVGGPSSCLRVGCAGAWVIWAAQPLAQLLWRV